MLTPKVKKEKKKKEIVPTDEQVDAVKHTGSDLLLSAGAGSGKTATLTDRIVKRITEDEVDISSMLVVTFTKDAANELKTRIANKLSSQLQKDPNSSWLRSQFVKVTSADISTIHSFCFKCIRPYFDKFNLDGDVRIGETNELDLLKNEAMNEVLDEFYEADVIDPDFLLAVDCCSSYTDESTLPTVLRELHDKDLSSCADGIDILLRKHVPGTEFFHTPHGQALLRYVTRIVNHFSPLIEAFYEEAISDENNTKYVKCLSALNQTYSELALCLENPSYMKVKSILNSYKPADARGGSTKAAPTFKDIAFLDEVRKDAHKKLIHLRDEYFYSDNSTIDAVFEQNEKICFAIYKVLKAYKDAYQEKKRKHALCDFDDLEKFTLELFYKNGEISDIAREISRNYKDIYIDEYQDVNSVQDKIFKAITNNNRFMVGDIKQSIYGFRAAEPELFSAYRDTFLPYKERVSGQGATIFMSDNFRCDPDIIDLTNYMSDYMFENSFGFTYEKEGDKLKPSKDHEEYDDDGNLKPFNPQKVELCIIDKSKIDEDSFLKKETAQAEFVAQEIRRLLDNGYLPNGDKVEEKHIAILLRKMNPGHGQKYIDALNKYGIKHEYRQEVSFFEKPHIILLISLLNVLDNPSKDVYLTAALHSCIWDFSLEELIKIKRFSKDKGNLYSALKHYKDDSDVDLKDKVTEFLAELDSLRKGIDKMNSYEIISYIMNKKSFISFCDKNMRHDVIKLYNIARAYEQGTFKGLYSFLRHVDDISAKGGLEEAVTSDPENSVRILTMHKSKGLEYEICFLGDLEKDYFKGIRVKPVLFHREIGICGYVSRDGGVVKYDNLLRKCIDLALHDERKEEAMRLLYVAMTRARSKLYLTATFDNLSKKKEGTCLYDRMATPYLIYSNTSHADMLMNARPYLYPFLDERPNVTESIYNFEPHQELEDQEVTVSQEDIEKILAKRFSFKYDYSHLEEIPSKLSISTLRPVAAEGENQDTMNNELAPAKKKFSIDHLPSFDLKKKPDATGAERGTATHVFLQFCDFKKLKDNGFDTELKRLVDEHFISPAMAQLVSKKHIEAFKNKPGLIDELLNAKKVIREFRFNLFLPAKEFFGNKAITDERVLVQGVVDCLYKNAQGEFILVDYKTDQETDENELVSRHRTQLTYYKRACEEMFKCKISKVQIYSVTLGKTINIE